ncbi:MAG TPA: carboxypeptidase-like regulatory domain-containing protein [Cyclobacteriaceae bacterium]|nr:carboxypeptidase-like regulatory domain-containing protein [Cyclobacteriaceae bacterium]
MRKYLLVSFLLAGFATNAQVLVRGRVLDAETGEAVPFVNIGLFELNVGTLSDEDGSFELTVPAGHSQDSILFSSIGYKRTRMQVTAFQASTEISVPLTPMRILLKDVTVKSRRYKHLRLGWMGGKDGVIPLDTIQGGGAVAVLLESPSTTNFVDKLQVRLMYNSKDTLKFRLHFFAYDSLRDAPGVELLRQEVMLIEHKRFGWLRFNLVNRDIRIDAKRFFVGFEWIESRADRANMLAGLRDWERWRKQQYEAGNQKVEKRIVDGKTTYKYIGDMRDWPGFSQLPPFTGLMVETGKTLQTQKYRTFERKTSFGKWTELGSTLNAVVTISY